MSRTAFATSYDHFLQQLGMAAERVLITDYDGTIAPFHKVRSCATPYPKVPNLLQAITTSCKTRLIILTGRAAYEVPPLLGVRPTPEIWGTYGVEKIFPDGRYEDVLVSDEALQILLEAETELDREGLGDWMEFKLAGVALHWRDLPSAEVLMIRTKGYRILQRWANQSTVVLSEFEGGIELRLASANKGDSLQALLSTLNPGVPVAYLGDDATDEEAFRVLNGRGLTALVGQKPRFTAAQIWLRPPKELIRFLTQWVMACGGTL